MTLVRTAATLLALLLAAQVSASDADPWPARFEPLAFLLGHCWRAPFPNGQSDVQCFQSMYRGRLVHNTHVVEGSEPRYEGTTIYTWDSDRARLRFHYFTSTGAVSEGHLIAEPDGYTIPERHVGADGRVSELESRFRRVDADTYSVLTRQHGEGEWVDIGERTYRRISACPTEGSCRPPDADAPALRDGDVQ